jgi:ElaB/YqjD/DUF883 family membrane-anchored ribosome-binding protein
MTTATDYSGARSIDSASDQAHRAVDRAKDKAAPFLDRAASAAHRTIDNVTNASGPAVQWMSDSSKQLAERSTKFADAATDQVRARPFVAVGAALALGYLIGKLLQR